MSPSGFPLAWVFPQPRPECPRQNHPTHWSPAFCGSGRESRSQFRLLCGRNGLPARSKPTASSARRSTTKRLRHRARPWPGRSRLPPTDIDACDYAAFRNGGSKGSRLMRAGAVRRADRRLCDDTKGKVFSAARLSRCRGGSSVAARSFFEVKEVSEADRGKSDPAMAAH